MDIQVENRQSVFTFDTVSAQRVVESVLSLESASCDEIIVHFVEEAEICFVHAEFFDDPSPTDCISIQVDPPNTPSCFLGEIFISPQAALDYLKEQAGDFYEEVTLYLVHGLLHLLGYDDIEEADRQKMRVAEKRQMDYLRENNTLLKR